MDAPLIGLTTYRQRAAWGVWDARADLLPTEYAASVEAAGGVPLLLPPVAAPGAAARVVARIDALVVSGGADVDPAAYGAEPHPETAAWQPDRDEWELSLLTAAAEVGLPVLGICRGMQLMAVHAGGTLDQHTPDLVGHAQHSPGGDAYGSIEVRTAEGSRLAGLVGATAEVSCHHHQSVATHPGFTAVARAEDGTLEAMEATGDRYCLAVQWHPETRLEIGLMAGLVAAAREHAAS
ncbi:gamma-glutamyl-gamma-aminobutyrate hydrolase family protein [Nocardioides sp. zg-1308]|uniref:gamma-glutamyl-gamma-aminobutyrate hydrolase family protein n=1 Tax=Nocardioides TaxID=1839 RepID=UPI001556FDAF|nr:gamma-glutamyl-gamma-aminobutyrate hydrolase family protein [Nocardioides sp. S-34]NPD07111.1 gamma-glutamyl-gamma-aminobutyrate hydrolase family protein [Nocardioides sp. zg-1308]WQQ20547.1 gamma-glutamyl-gamma-aminobutyrate hydrolase family protein [Nocardioides sp. S-34]